MGYVLAPGGKFMSASHLRKRRIPRRIWNCEPNRWIEAAHLLGRNTKRAKVSFFRPGRSEPARELAGATPDAAVTNPRPLPAGTQTTSAKMVARSCDFD
jgi:hypothetical protein